MPEATTPRKNNKAAVAIALLSIVVIIQSIKIWMDYKEKIEVREVLVTTESELTETLQRLDEIRVELNEKITEIEKLGGDVKDLQKAKAEVESELRSAKKRFGKDISELKDRVEGYEELLELKDVEIEKLKTVNQELFTENRSLKSRQNKLSDSINRLAQNKEELVNKVALASQLKAENVAIASVNSRGKENDSPFRSRQLEKLKVEFNIAENKVAPIEGKTIMVRITDENGQPIFDMTRGSGTFQLNGREEFYTSSQEILFDNTKQKLTFMYEKGSEYASGVYSVEIYTDGYLMGRSQFTVR
jgi:peptidoglycan hydrolase CwlO-like protein